MDIGNMGEKIEDMAVEKGGDAVDDRTGDKYSDKVDAVQEKADDMLGGDQK